MAPGESLDGLACTARACAARTADALALVKATLGADLAFAGRDTARAFDARRGTRLPYVAHSSRVEDVLELATRTIGWWWTVRADGVLELQPPR